MSGHAVSHDVAGSVAAAHVDLARDRRAEAWTWGLLLSRSALAVMLPLGQLADRG
jgi:hypothetical protein